MSMNNSNTLKYTCLWCDNDLYIEKKDYLVCKANKCFYHKGCLKQYYIEQCEKRLNWGYSYSGYKSYKKHVCKCGLNVIVHNKLKNKIKHNLLNIVKCSPLFLLVLVILI